MNLDRATLNFLNAFPETAKTEGQRLHEEGCVTQIFGNHLFIQGRVEDGDWTCRTSIRLQGNDWTGDCSCGAGEARCPALYATMQERVARGGNLPEVPNEIGAKSLTEMLEERLARPLTNEEDEYLNKVEKRFRRFELEREIFDSDIVRLNPRWEIENFDPLLLWPTPPQNIIEFWNYIAYAFEKRGLDIPSFMEVVTDQLWTEKQMAIWERERELSEWRFTVEKFEGRTGVEEGVKAVEFRLQVGGREARLMMRPAGQPDSAFDRIADEEAFEEVRNRFHAGKLRMDPASEILWNQFLRGSDEIAADENEVDETDGSLRLDRLANCQLLNRLLHQPEVSDSIVTLDGRPFKRAEKPLRWVCRDDSLGSDDLEVQLVTGEGIDVPHTVRLLPGEENLFLSDETIFSGPDFWGEDPLVEPRYTIPREVIETEDGVEFLRDLEAQLPEGLSKRVTVEPLAVTLEMQLASNTTGAASEHILVKAIAKNDDGSREEILSRKGWEPVKVKEKPEGDDSIFQYDRSVAHRVPGVLEPMALTYDANTASFRGRVTKNFPEKYSEWRETIPEEFTVIADADLSTIDAEPVEAQVSFEVVDQEIDWFDLKVNVQVEGMDLSPAEVKSLVAARGGFVRMEEGGWLRLRMNLSDEQKEAVSRIGLDPFDLSGETHRMHALQLAEPLAKEVFDAKAWEKISSRARKLELQVRPSIPEGLQVDLRPYQVEGFNFLAYLAANRFGGILADDMGLGKTIQTLTWLLWVRQKAGSSAPPSLVVCPKSVLDVWAAEVRKAAPEIHVEVLRSRADLDIDHVKKNVDLLVVNYSQLRGAADDLLAMEWLAVVLDEGQQIKNPDSKAAKSARSINAQHRLVLTGTPIENRLLDIWSLMAFAMPGILGDRKYFRERFDRRKDAQSQMRLTARLRPFLLRRTKGEVALDLPPKVEEDIFCNLEPKQQELYNAEMTRIQEILAGTRTDEALRKNSFVILQGLMRLRQIACHPALLDSKYANEESAKMNSLFYHLDQLREEGHKVLVFSQFVSMLDIIKERLENEGHPYCYLTGQTQDRQGVIEKFQTSEDPEVFLLSLKAGGSGLNLTSASYVILYDPWWNPAVENQAIDRCHRIGQESKVNAYRLLVRNSVEEKIRTLQNQKRAMMTGVLGEEGFARTLELDDLEFLFGRG